jgi:hypothetical protein
MRVLIAIDDTDNLESRGTGHRARQLARALDGAAVAVHGITRHQLLVDPRIPYTSHNSSACLDTEFAPEQWAAALALCRDFLLRDSAPGSDVGLCLAAWDQVDARIVELGQRAKREVLERSEVEALAATASIALEGLTGTGGGIIGALAAVGLRAGGNDGRFLWLPGLRELDGVFPAAELRARLGLDTIATEEGHLVGPAERVALGDWPRPLLRSGNVTLVVEEADHAEYRWIVASKRRLKELSD